MPTANRTTYVQLHPSISFHLANEPQTHPFSSTPIVRVPRDGRSQRDWRGVSGEGGLATTHRSPPPQVLRDGHAPRRRRRRRRLRMARRRRVGRDADDLYDGQRRLLPRRERRLQCAAARRRVVLSPLPPALPLPPASRGTDGGARSVPTAARRRATRRGAGLAKASFGPLLTPVSRAACHSRGAAVGSARGAGTMHHHSPPSPAPLRLPRATRPDAGKHHNFEGGVRGVAFVAGGVVPAAARGTAFGGLMHAVSGNDSH